MGDWYKVRADDINQNGGSGMLWRQYGGSPSRALQAIYPEHVFLPWKFSSVSKLFWPQLENQIQFFDWVKNEVGGVGCFDVHQSRCSVGITENG